MWLQFEQFSDADNSYLLTVGRALCLAQHFETSCSAVLGWASLVIAAKRGQVSWEEGGKVVWPSDQLLNAVLAHRIEKLSKMMTLAEVETSTLVAAKNGRNFIAHQAAVPLAYYDSGRWDQFIEILPELFEQVKAVAAGDNLVSAWCYEINEKERAPNSYRRHYPANTCRWIFSDFLGDLSDIGVDWHFD